MPPIMFVTARISQSVALFTGLPFSFFLFLLADSTVSIEYVSENYTVTIRTLMFPRCVFSCGFSTC